MLAARKQKQALGAHKFEPSAQQRAQVRTFAGLGLPQDQICRLVGMSEAALRNHFEEELGLGIAQANSQVMGALYKSAVEEKNVTAQIFWAKARLGMSEKTQTEQLGPDGKPIDPNARPIVVLKVER